MKWNAFSEKMPVLGSNIIVAHERGNLVGIAEFDLSMRKAMLNDGDYYALSYYSDDSSEDQEYDIRISDFWAYPSSMKLPKKAKQKC